MYFYLVMPDSGVMIEEYQNVTTKKEVKSITTFAKREGLEILWSHTDPGSQSLKVITFNINTQYDKVVETIDNIPEWKDAQYNLYVTHSHNAHIYIKLQKALPIEKATNLFDEIKEVLNNHKLIIFNTEPYQLLEFPLYPNPRKKTQLYPLREAFDIITLKKKEG